MEMSVGFADNDKNDDFYINKGYKMEESPLGKVFYPGKGVVKKGKIVIRYEIKPWLSAFEIDGLRPAKMRGKNYTPSMQVILQYTRAFGSISRKDAMDISGLTASQTSKLLKRIVEGGYLAAEGNGRSRRYVLTEEGKKYR